MKAFEYATPKGDRQAIGLLGQNWDDAAVFAGGTELLSLMKDGIVAPKRLVNIKQIPGLDKVTFDASGMRIGALVRLQDFADNVDVRRRFPLIAWAADEAASPQIRNMATLGGNLCQRPRCWYFRNGFGLLGQKDGKSLVTAGDNRYHAILGNEGPAYFVSPSTVAPVLIAYNAEVQIFDGRGFREIPAEKFFIVPKSDQEREHQLRPNEMVSAVMVPAANGLRAGHYEVRQKEAFDWPYAISAVALRMNGSTVQSARVVMGHVAPIPWISNEAAQALVGKAVTPATADQAAQAAVSKAKSLGRNEQKIHLARVAVKRAILAAAGSTEHAGFSQNGSHGGAA